MLDPTPRPSLRTWQPTPTAALVAVLASAALYALVPAFARPLTGAGVPAVEVAFARVLVPALALVGSIDLRPGRRRATAWGLASGAAIGVGGAAHVHVLEVGAVGSAAIASMAAPLAAMGAAAALFRRRPSRRAVGAGALVVAAAVIGLGPTGGAAWTPWVLVAPVTFGFSIAVLTERLGTLDVLARTATVCAGAAIGLAPLLARPGSGAVVPRGWSLVALVGCGLVGALVPMILYGAGAPTLGAAGASLVGSAELPLTFAVAALALGESTTIGQLGAALLIGVAVLVGSTDPARIGPAAHGAAARRATVAPRGRARWPAPSATARPVSRPRP